MPRVARSIFRQAPDGSAGPVDRPGPRAQSRQTVVDPPPSPDPLDAAWRALEGRWDDDPAHKAFVALAQSLDRLPDAAQRYRAALADPRDPKGPQARAGIDRILAVAMLQLEPIRRPPRAGRVAWIIPLSVGGLMVMVAVTASRVFHLPRLASPPALLGLLALCLLLPWRRASGRAPPA